MQHWINLYNFSSSMQTVELNMFREICFSGKNVFGQFFFCDNKL